MPPNQYIAREHDSKAAGGVFVGQLLGQVHQRQKPVNVESLTPWRLPAKATQSPLAPENAPAEFKTPPQNLPLRHRSTKWPWLIAVVTALLATALVSQTPTRQKVEAIVARNDEIDLATLFWEKAATNLSHPAVEEQTAYEVRHSINHANLTATDSKTYATTLVSFLTTDLLPLIMPVGKSLRCSDIPQLESVIRETHSRSVRIVTSLQLALNHTQRAGWLLQNACQLIAAKQRNLENSNARFIAVVLEIVAQEKSQQTLRQYSNYQVTLSILKPVQKDVALSVTLLGKAKDRWTHFGGGVDQLASEIVYWRKDAAGETCGEPGITSFRQQVLQVVASVTDIG